MTVDVHEASAYSIYIVIRYNNAVLTAVMSLRAVHSCVQLYQFLCCLGKPCSAGNISSATSSHPKPLCLVGKEVAYTSGEGFS